MPKPAPTAERLREVLEYCPETGAFIWKERVAFANDPRSVAGWNKTYAGRPAMTAKTRDGYSIGSVDNKLVFAHRVAFAHFHGRWPEADIDHINGVRDDNRIANLREATRRQNLWNQARPSRARSRFKGVSWSEDTGKWAPRITTPEGKNLYFGLYASEVEAAKVYDTAAREIHGAFARLNFPDDLSRASKPSA